MSALPSQASPDRPTLLLNPVARFADLRALAWSGCRLYASRGYELLRADLSPENLNGIHWQPIARYRPPWWRNITSATRLGTRLVRDGFHALAIVPSGALIAAVPGVIVTAAAGEQAFRLSHRIVRGTRPLHITATPNGTVFWGEYFDNSSREEVHIYASTDEGAHWNVAYTFSRGAIRHVHNIIHDPWQNCLWILTGDYGGECRILRANCDLTGMETVLQGNQQARAVALVRMENGVYFSSDTPLEQNHIFFLDRSGNLSRRTTISSSSINGCRVGNNIFFSTMVEPSAVNSDRNIRIFASADGENWNAPLAWEKDRWPMKLFQYGNAFFPDGNNSTKILALTTVAVQNDDLATLLYSLSS